VHDTVNLEALGVPTVFVASTEFVDAADAQAAALGADPARVFVPHPIQDRTDDEIRALADAAVDGVVRAVTA
jgi:alkanesulfonate monooxygenase SsuD/methylene tetrahydromethanopterin reductase-like flavin-dependent oxidoreductase (luciferase family)